MAFLKCADKTLNLSTTQVMGILNVTPDSFSDGGHLFDREKIDLDKLLYSAQQMVTDGATILDIGGESTRPDAQPVTVEQEMNRVLPALEWLRNRLDVVLSVDTSSAALMVEAAKMGAGLINDVRALEAPGAMDAAVASGLPVCLMHMQGSPLTMQLAPEYDNVTAQVMGYLRSRAQACEQNGMKPESILLDPGFGFGKTLEQNLTLHSAMDSFSRLGYPLLIGTSRKSMFGQLLGRDVSDRLAGSLASVAYATMHGAAIVRVHDVKESMDTVKVIAAIKGCGNE